MNAVKRSLPTGFESSQPPGFKGKEESHPPRLVRRGLEEQIGEAVDRIENDAWPDGSGDKVQRPRVLNMDDVIPAALDCRPNRAGHPAGLDHHGL